MTKTTKHDDDNDQAAQGRRLAQSRGATDNDRNYDAQGAALLRAKPEDVDERRVLIEEKQFDFIERTKPEDPTERGRGQLTRDNVNPAIPSAPPGTGGIVQPQSTSGGVPPPAVVVTTEALPGDPAYLPSINEPAGTVVGAPPGEGGNGETSDEAPVLTGITPDSVVLGEPSFTIYIAGSNLAATSVIVFADQDEPTTLESDGTVSTGVNMDVWEGAGVVQVAVRNNDKLSNELEFTFVAAEPEADAASSRGKKSKRKR